jgi:hypothetical protein
MPARSALININYVSIVVFRTITIDQAMAIWIAPRRLESPQGSG